MGKGGRGEGGKGGAVQRILAVSHLFSRGRSWDQWSQTLQTAYKEGITENWLAIQGYHLITTEA